MNEQRADISIITPVFNSGPYLVDLVHTVARQTVLPRELLLVNDGSRPATTATLEYLAAQYPDLVRLKNMPRNSGPAAARNLGIESAGSRHLMFIDSDDFPADDRVVADVATRCIGSDFDMMACKAVHYRQSLFSGRGRYERRWYGSPFKGDLRGETMTSAPQLCRGVSLWNFVYDRAFLTERGKLFSTSVGRREDFPFVNMNLAAAKKIDSYDRDIIAHRPILQSIMRTANLSDLSSIVTGYILIRKEFSLLGLDESSQRSFIDLHYLQNVFNLAVEGLAIDPSADVSAPMAQLRDTFMDGPDARNFFKMLSKSGSIGREFVLGDNMKERFRSLARHRAIVHSDRAVLERLEAEAKGRRPVRRRTKIVEQPRRRLVLHVGLTKTGTTSLQVFLNQNREALADHIYYPATGLTWQKEEGGNGA